MKSPSLLPSGRWRGGPTGPLLVLVAVVLCWQAVLAGSYGEQPPSAGAHGGQPPSAVELGASQSHEASDSTEAQGRPGDTAAGQPDAVPTTAAASETASDETAPAARQPKDHYALWVLAPAVAAIVLAIITRQVLVALPLGILLGAGMMCALKGIQNPITIVQYAVEHYLFGVLFPLEPGNAEQRKQAYQHLQTLTFTLFIGGMIGVIEANGGTRAMVSRVTHLMRTRRGGQLGALGAGLVVFFDDYANCLIVGPAMRPVFDKLRLSREKLAYIVDSTAAPVASMFIGTWLAAEISFLDTALGTLGDKRPDFLAGVNGAMCFWRSLPYRTYAILALFMVFLLAVTGRDFGSMRKAESQAADRREPSDEAAADSESASRWRWLLGFVPVAMLVVLTLTLLLVTGHTKAAAAGMTFDFGSLRGIGAAIKDMLGKADSYQALLYAGITALALSVIVSVASRALSLGKTCEAMSHGMSRIFVAQIVLVMAWGLSSATEDLQLGEVARGFLTDLEQRQLFTVTLLPTAIFVTACIVSFSTGTSWGTMGILCPTTVAVAAHLVGPLDPSQAVPLFYASIGAVLTGAVFGDHCSPISDTTVLSAVASECEVTAHVRTQLPYALVVAVCGLLGTDLLDYVLFRWYPTFRADYWNVYFGTVCGALLLVLVVFAVGRRPAASRGEPQIIIQGRRPPNV